MLQHATIEIMTQWGEISFQNRPNGFRKSERIPAHAAGLQHVRRERSGADLHSGSNFGALPQLHIVSSSRPSQSLDPGTLKRWRKKPIRDRRSNKSMTEPVESAPLGLMLLKGQSRPGGGLRGTPFLRLHCAGKIPGLSLWHRKDLLVASKSSMPQRSSIVTRKYCSLCT